MTLPPKMPTAHTTLDEQLKKPNVLIIDSRESEEVGFNKDFIGAKHVPVSEIANKLDQFGEDKNRPIILYFGRTSRTAHAEKLLKEHGYTDVMSTSNASALQIATQRWRVLPGY